MRFVGHIVHPPHDKTPRISGVNLEPVSHQSILKLHQTKLCDFSRGPPRANNCYIRSSLRFENFAHVVEIPQESLLPRLNKLSSGMRIHWPRRLILHGFASENGIAMTAYNCLKKPGPQSTTKTSLRRISRSRSSSYT